MDALLYSAVTFVALFIWMGLRDIAEAIRDLRDEETDE
jgi:hypothetical protein